MFELLGNWLLTLINNIGYFGLIFSMFIESTFIPLPSEVILIPAGILWYQKVFDPILIIICGTFGSILGASLNYFIGAKLGRPLIYKHLKWFFFSEQKLKKLDLFFEKYGALSIFFGRLIFGVRHYISFPAGFTKMNKKKFVLFTGLGSLLWVTFLTILGYYFGLQMHLIKKYMYLFTILIILVIIMAIFIYINKNYNLFTKIKIKIKENKEKRKQKKLNKLKNKKI